MRTISQNLFDWYLDENGSRARWYNETQNMCWLFPYSARGQLTYQDSIRLFNINKFFLITVLISFVDNRRYFEVRRIEEMTLDEFIEQIMQENEYREAYETLKRFTE